MQVRAFSYILLLVIGLWDASPSCDAQSMPDPPPIDSLIAGIRARLAFCDAQWTDMTYIATTHERELGTDGSVKEEKTSRARVYARRGTERVVLEGVWNSGKPVPEKTLREEKGRLKEEMRDRRRSMHTLPDQHVNAWQVGVLEPFAEELDGRYDFLGSTLDTVNGVEAWKITVAPKEDAEGLVRGTAWVRTDTYDAVAEEYEMARLPIHLNEHKFTLKHARVDASCTMAHYSHITWTNKVHITEFNRGNKGVTIDSMMFYHEAETIIDSVAVDSSLPDSLFEITDY